MPVFDFSTLFQGLYTAKQSMQDSVLKGGDLRGWSHVSRVISEAAQAPGGGDPDDQAAYLRNYRGFVNVGVSDAVVTINGERHTLTAGLTYCGAHSEIQLMLEQSLKFNLGLTLGTQADFVANPGMDSFFS